MNPNLTVIGRREAQALGKKRFYTGEPCARGHDVERFVSNGGCVDCVNLKTAPNAKQRLARNQGWPPRAIVFAVNFAPLPEEIAAAFLYAEAQGWLAAALQHVHDDPRLLVQYGPTLSVEEQGRMLAALERHRIITERVAASLTPAQAPAPLEEPECWECVCGHIQNWATLECPRCGVSRATAAGM